jgi:cellulose synthase/poly-beta-1,6-N-acetylglucosamine synthase-like glycosyltransferase
MIGLLWLVSIACVGWVLFAYAGYPIALLALRARSPRPLRKADRFPPISVIIAVHNGARDLSKKLEATLTLDYPGDREVIVSSDGSTDETAAIAESFADRGVVALACPERRGKEAAQARAIQRARGEILVFTDVGAELEPGALRQIVRPFADPEVGGVSSEDLVESEQGEGAYVRYEMALRRLENQTTTLVGLSGSFFAVRRSLADPWPENLASDFRSALECARRGLRAVAEPAAEARFRATSDPSAEWQRKVRTVRRGLAVLSAYRDLLHPRFGRAAFSLWGHKVARFTAPLALLALLLASAAGAGGSRWLALLLAAQILLYGTGGLALLFPPLGRLGVPRLAAFFLLVNASTLVAWVHHLSGQAPVTWSPTRR